MPHSTTKPTAVNYTAGVPIEQYSPEDPGSDSTLDASAEHERRALEAVLYALWAAFWLLMLIVAVQDELHSKAVQLWEPVLWEGSSALVATSILALQRRAEPRYARHLEHPGTWFAHHLKWLPLVAVAFIASVFAIRHGVYAALGRQYRHESWLFVGAYESVKLLLYSSLWLGVIFGLHTFRRWRSERQRLLLLQKTLAEAQLENLRAQLHPHFLFNALNTVSSLMHVDVDRADRLLSRLGDLLRSSLASSRHEMTSLEAELRLLASYADVMRERYPDRVTLEWRVPSELQGASLPSLLLQPLLENAFKHGVERSTAPVTVTIAAERVDGSLHIAIRNSGTALAPEPRQGVGLHNSRERLRVIYGGAATLELGQRGADVEAAVRLPFREHAA